MEIMRFFNVLLIVIFFCGPISAQTLFEDGGSSSSSTIQLNTVSKAKSSQVISLQNKRKQMISTNLEALIARGDIQLSYEAAKDAGWATILFAHVNPQSNFSHKQVILGLWAVVDYTLIKGLLIQMFTCKVYLGLIIIQRGT